MGCAPLRGTVPRLTSRQARLLRRIYDNPAATTVELTKRFSNPTITRADLAALVNASLVVPVTETRDETRDDTGITIGITGPNGTRQSSTMHILTQHTDRDTLRNGELHWRTTRPGNRYVRRGNLTDIRRDTRGARLDDWWLCPRGTQMRNETLARLRTREAPLGPLERPERALEAAAWALTDIVDEPTAHEMLRQPWPELSARSPHAAAAAGATVAQLQAAAEARVERRRRTATRSRQQRLEAATGDEAHLIATVGRIQERWAPQQGWCCGTVTYRTMRA